MPTPVKSINRKQLAQLAGVSPAVITAVMQNKPSTIAVSRETRERILRLAKEHQYQRDIVGLSLSCKQTFLLGIVFQEAMRHFMWEIIHGLESVAAGNDYALLVFPSPPTVQEEAERLQRAMKRKVDGLVCMPVLNEQGSLNTAMYESIKGGGTPIVQVYGDYLPGVPSVRIDDVRAARMATQYLIDLGHKRILHFTHQDSAFPAIPNRLKTSYLRKQGYLQAMQDAGLEPMIVETEADTDPSLRNYRSTAPQILNHPGRPTAVFCSSDGRATGLMQGLQQRGISIPGDMSIMGFDNTVFATATSPQLTTVNTLRVEIGRLAGEILLRMIQGKNAESQSVQSQLCIRESCAAL